MSSQRSLNFVLPNGDKITHLYRVEQAFIFDYCKFENSSTGVTWKLKVGKNFISHEAREQIIRFGLSNKISPIGGKILFRLTVIAYCSFSENLVQFQFFVGRVIDKVECSLEVSCTSIVLTHVLIDTVFLIQNLQ